MRGYKRKAQQACDQLGELGQLTYTLQAAGVAYAGNARWSEAVESLFRAAEIAEQLRDKRQWEECTSHRTGIPLYSLYSMIYLPRTPPRPCVPPVTRAPPLPHTHALLQGSFATGPTHPPIPTRMLCYRAHLEYYRGDFPLAKQLYEEAMKSAQERGDKQIVNRRGSIDPIPPRPIPSQPIRSHTTPHHTTTTTTTTPHPHHTTQPSQPRAAPPRACTIFLRCRAGIAAVLIVVNDLTGAIDILKSTNSYGQLALCLMREGNHEAALEKALSVKDRSFPSHE